MTVNQSNMSQRPVSSKIAAFFDVDNTLIPGTAIEVRFFHYLRRQGIVGWTDAARSLRYLLQHMPPVSLHPLRARKLYLEGKRPETIEPLADAFVQRDIRPFVSRAAVARMRSEERRVGKECRSRWSA